MSQAWTLWLPRESAGSLASLRLVPGLGVCEEEGAVWLHGKAIDERLAAELQRIPGGQRYDVLEDGQLVLRGHLVPKGRLPAGPWKLLDEWFVLELPASESPGASFGQVELSLVRSAEEREPALLETDLRRLAEYVDTAPQWRLDRWSFAATLAGRILVRGTPLPPVPGGLWVESAGVCVPAGWTWNPGVDAAVVRQLLHLADNDLALLHPVGQYEVVSEADWVRMSRSALRRTMEAGVP